MCSTTRRAMVDNERGSRVSSASRLHVTPPNQWFEMVLTNCHPVNLSDRSGDISLSQSVYDVLRLPIQAKIIGVQGFISFAVGLIGLDNLPRLDPTIEVVSGQQPRGVSRQKRIAV